MSELEEVQKLIAEECDMLKELLLKKNRVYGNSAIFPKRIFSAQSPIEQIKVRMDDKLSRIENMKISANKDAEVEDAYMDLAGYLILYRVAERIHRNEENGDIQT